LKVGKDMSQDEWQVALESQTRLMRDDSDPRGREPRRRLVIDALAVAPSAAAFGLVYGLAAREAGLSALETAAMSVLVLAGSAQFAAVGLLAQGSGSLAIVLTTIVLNARHLLYGAALAPWVARKSRATRAAMAYILSDEVFALALAHFARIGRADLRSYWITGVIPAAWIVASVVGYGAGQLVQDPARWGLDVVFPIAMGGLAIGFLSDSGARIAAAAAAVASVAVALAGSVPLAVVVASIAAPIVGRRLGTRLGH